MSAQNKSTGLKRAPFRRAVIAIRSLVLACAFRLKGQCIVTNRADF